MNTRFDYKKTEAIKVFLNPHGRIYSRKKTMLDSRDQRALANAVKRARFMGLLPYVSE